MIENYREGQTQILVLRPNCSLSWAGNCWLIAVLGGTTLAVGMIWAVSGAWLVLPFAGVEVVALSAGLYCTNRKLQIRQVLRISDAAVDVEVGSALPSKRWQLDRTRVGLVVECARHPWDAATVVLFDQRQQVVLGEFLAQDDTGELLQLLQSAGLHLRRESPAQRRAF